MHSQPILGRFSQKKFSTLTAQNERPEKPDVAYSLSKSALSYLNLQTAVYELPDEGRSYKQMGQFGHSLRLPPRGYSAWGY